VGGGGEAPEGPADAAALRKQLRLLRREAAANEQKWQRTLEREVALMRAGTLAELLGHVTDGLAASYGLDAVTLVLADPGHEIRHLLQSAGGRLESFPGVAFVDDVAALGLRVAAGGRPWLGRYVERLHRPLFPAATGLRSLALLPLGQVGMLAFGSDDPERFNYRLGVDFLQHLATVVAVCVENACNRARILRSGLEDFLTGWHNRRYLEARLVEEVAHAERTGTSVACLMLDVDHFKALNDSCGHLAGDAALREVTARIGRQVRASDTAARFGGDELAIVLPDADPEDAVRLAERIRADLVTPVAVGDGREWRVTLSIGAAAIRPRRGEGATRALADGLLAAADRALYAAKAAGRDRVVLAPG
jgi:diguanylate cyclase (GGDEF)-like protein